MKTKLGISVTTFATLTYLLGLFSGYVVLTVVTGYILLCETDEVLRKSAVRAMLVMVAFSLISVLLGFIPNGINILDNLCNIFGGSFHIYFVTNTIAFINSVLSLVQKLVFLVLAFIAWTGKNVKIPVLDDLIDKYVTKNAHF